MNPSKAVCIGINYFGTSHQLRGCINDAHDMRDLLVEQYGYRPENVRLMTDDPSTPAALQPTRQNILDAFAWLRSDLAAGDKVALTYSGHGSHVYDRDGDEADRRDEVLCAVDGIVLDDEIHRHLAAEIPAGAQLTCFFDCCHSGTLLDLQYNFKCLAPQARRHANATYGMSVENNKRLGNRVSMFSGCYDAQVSMDIYCNENKKPCGAFTTNLKKTLRASDYQIANMELLREINARLERDRFQQVSQFSCSQPGLYAAPFDL